MLGGAAGGTLLGGALLSGAAGGGTAGGVMVGFAVGGAIVGGAAGSAGASRGALIGGGGGALIGGGGGALIGRGDSALIGGTLDKQSFYARCPQKSSASTAARCLLVEPPSLLAKPLFAVCPVAIAPGRAPAELARTRISRVQQSAHEACGIRGVRSQIREGSTS